MRSWRIDGALGDPYWLRSWALDNGVICYERLPAK